MSRYRRKTCPCHIGAGIALVAAALFCRTSPVDAAEQHDETWQVDEYVEVSGTTSYLIENGTGTALPVVGAEIGVDLWAAERPLAAGLFASYEIETLSDGEDVLVVGSWVRYRFSRWDLSTAVAYVAPSPSSAFWMHANKLAFRPRPGHKVSVETLSVLGTNSRPAFQLAYRVNVARNLSLTIGAGFGSNRLFDIAGNARVVWTIH